MSLQEAASSGSFNPGAAQPSDPKQTQWPHPPAAGGDAVDQTIAEPTSPFGAPYDPSVGPEEAIAGSGEPDMRATRRRAWTVVSLAIVIPAAVAGVIAWQLFGSDAEPAPVVTRVTTTPAQVETSEAQTATGTPVAASVSAETGNSATAAATTTQTATVAVSTEATAAEAETTAAAVAAEPAVDLSGLDPAARLAAWTNLETIQVLPGETLWLIAQNYNTTISAIATLNNISDPETLSIGQQLVIPVGFAEEIVETSAIVEDGTESAAVSGDSVGITAAVTEVPAATDELTNWHTIAPVLIEEGDSLQAIAVANDTTVEAIMALNGIADSNLIFVGDTLLIPVGFQGDAGPIVAAEQSVALEAGSEATATETTEDLMEDEGATGASAGDDLMEE
ncbi:MAG: LysM domain-containing protein [Chloroflexota bacterium]|nr:LysM domain-containing protein [Chloroflexota bacterium]